MPPSRKLFEPVKQEQIEMTDRPLIERIRDTEGSTPALSALGLRGMIDGMVADHFAERKPLRPLESNPTRVAECLAEAQAKRERKAAKLRKTAEESAQEDGDEQTTI